MPFHPRLGLGLAALGRPGYINLGHAGDLSAGHDPDAMRANAHAVLDAAYDAGVRYFDAARSYGRAEEFLADWLHRRNLLPDQVFVASKWGYTYTADWRIDRAPQLLASNMPELADETAVMAFDRIREPFQTFLAGRIE